MSKLKSLSLFVAITAGVIGFQSASQANFVQDAKCKAGLLATQKSKICSASGCGACKNVAEWCLNNKGGAYALSKSDPECYNLAHAKNYEGFEIAAEDLQPPVETPADDSASDTDSDSDA